MNGLLKGFNYLHVVHLFFFLVFAIYLFLRGIGDNAKNMKLLPNQITSYDFSQLVQIKFWKILHALKVLKFLTSAIHYSQMSGHIFHCLPLPYWSKKWRYTNYCRITCYNEAFTSIVTFVSRPMENYRFMLYYYMTNRNLYLCFSQHYETSI